MTRHGRPALLAALILFALFFTNVVVGAAGGRAPLDDVAEMLTLFAATIFFVAGVLTREAEAAGRNGPDVPQ